MQKFEYKVKVVKEGALGTVFLGASHIPVEQMEETMDTMGKKGWEMVFQVVEQHRFLLLWTREAVVMTFKKKINA